LKLPEVLEALLKAEDEAMEMRASAEQEAKIIVQKAHDKFAQTQEAFLNAARTDARAQVESARQAAEMEALHVAELANSGRKKMREHFEARSPALIAQLADGVAVKYARYAEHLKHAKSAALEEARGEAQ
jgi:vacuolar-type H+-ATPase subunit H